MEDPKGSPASEQATPERIMQLGLGFWGSKTLLSAVEIGLFSELAKGSLEFETLSERTPRGYLNKHAQAERGWWCLTY